MSDPKIARRIGLTDRRLKALKPATDGRGIVWDAILPGLAVRVGKTRRTFYAVRRRAGQSNPSWISLGQYPVMSLADARDKAPRGAGRPDRRR
jgi:hypothetical protein